jgi:hypothetical protein
MKRRFALGAKTSRFTYCVELFLLLTASAAWGQMVAPTSTSSSSADQVSPTFTPTSTSTSTFTATPTATSTENLFAVLTGTPTSTNTPDIFFHGTPTSTPTPTVTPTGTITPPPQYTPTMTSTPSISRASLALLPTAYSNAWDRWDGFNWNFAFSFYIGSIISRDFSKPDIDSLEPTRLALLTSDVKYAWLDDEGDQPGIASGLLLSFLAQVNSGSTATGNSAQSFQVAGNSAAGIYTVASKTVFPGTSVHMGYIYGLKDIGLVSNNYSQLLPLFTPKLTNVTDAPPSIFYTGFSTYFLGRYWKFEIWKPFPMTENPVLLNTQIEGLPLAFNLAYERWDQGYAVLGFINFPFTLIPQTPSY